MAGVKGMRWGDNRKSSEKIKAERQEEVREKIRGTSLLNFVQDYALTGEYRGQKVEGKRVDAALGLLRKVVPDLSAQEITEKREGWIDVLKRAAEVEKARKQAENAVQHEVSVPQIETRH